MKQLKNIFRLIGFIFFLSSCSGDTKNNKLIVGNWVGLTWSPGEKSFPLNEDNTHFSFDDRGNYNFQFMEHAEAGTYKVEHDMLFTKPEKQEQEIMVKIIKLTKDSMVFDMSRSGAAESLTLLRK
ncbi:hypothetical protein BH11BAC4_BH11BAC4_27020 [soil metagenome]